MKKIYSLLLATAVTIPVTVTAAGTDSSNSVRHSVTRTEKSSDVPAFPLKATLAPVNKSIKAMRKADANPTIEGFWTLYLGDFYDANGEFGYIPVSFEATVNDNNVTFTPKMDSNRFYEFIALFNPEDNTLTISKKMLSVVNGGYFFQVPFYYDADEEDLIDMTQLVGQYDPAENSIIFEPDQGIAWGVYKNAMGTEIDYDLAIFDLNSGYLFDPYKALEGNWEVIGNAQFEDPWLVPALGINQAENIYDVQFEQDSDNPYRFRLVNPYKQGPVAQWNGSEGGYITFDISDPDHVLFLPTDAGFYNTAILPGGGISSFYCYNALGYEVVNQPVLSVEEVIELYDYIPFTKYDSAQNKVILSYVEDGGQRAYDANFGYQAVPLGGNFWDGVSMAGSITFPSWFQAGVSDVIIDENAPIEYFNLNGIRIANPQQGQIIIKRQGSKVTKEIIK